MGRGNAAKRVRIRRTWPQRFALGLGSVTSVGCISTGAALWYANHTLGQVQKVTITHAEPTPVVAKAKTTDVPSPESSVAPAPGETTTTTSELAVPALVDPKAINFLLVGSDSRDCIDPNSPYAGAFLANGDTGYNSDTIMAIRVDPVTSQAAILSFPRDLWVRMPNSQGRGKINSVYTKKNPSRLVQTVEENFKLRVDHYIDVDFCAFKDVVDAIDGVSVPFIFPAADSHTGLNVDKGCHRFLGEEALAYTRSRYYEWFDGKSWRADLDSDLTRIARQQDFVKRTLQKALDKGARKPAVAKKLLDVALARVKVDKDLTPNDLLILAQSLKGLDPATIKSYRFDGPFGGNGEYIVPSFDDPTNKAILSVFRGEARLKNAPPGGATSSASPSSSGSSSSSSSSAASTTLLTTTTILAKSLGGGNASSSTSTSNAAPPVIEVDETKVNSAVVPPNDPTCR